MPPVALKRVAFKMRVHPDKVPEYEHRHNPIWPELHQALKAHGLHTYSIFLDEDTHTLFGYVEVESVERWNAIAQSDICRRWWLSMKDLMPSNPDNSPVSSPLREVFHFGGG